MSDPIDFQTRRSSTLKELSASVKNLKAEIQFEAVRQDIERGNTQSERIDKSLADARLSAYAYRDALANHARQVNAAWQTMTRILPKKIEQEIAILRGNTHALTILLNQAMDAPDNEAVFDRCCNALETEITGQQSKIQEAETRLMNLYKPVQAAMNSLEDYIRDVQWALETVGESHVDFDGEHVYIACKAEWSTTGKAGDDPDGILYVTHKRLLFEQKEKQGKFLGVFGGKKVQNALWEVDLAHLQSSEAERKGIIGGRAMLTLTFSPDASLPSITLEVKGGFGNERLERMLMQAKDGQFTPPLDVPDISEHR